MVFFLLMIEDSNMLKRCNIRMLNANMGDYITQLTNLIEAIKIEAREKWLI